MEEHEATTSRREAHSLVKSFTANNQIMQDQLMRKIDELQDQLLSLAERQAAFAAAISTWKSDVERTLRDLPAIVDNNAKGLQAVETTLERLNADLDITAKFLVDHEAKLDEVAAAQHVKPFTIEHEAEARNGRG